MMSAGPPSAPSQAWDDPVPYIYGCLAVLLILIAVPLSVLACYHARVALRGVPRGPDEEDKPEKVAVPDAEPKIVVVMAGEDVPSYIAMPKQKTGHVS
ncbi:hypothetical protein MLD38_022570 [Melastoma candidum]|uniref:Uncharacterized protein n=1 Tax=Melastoma candidum TaxID=119954 RepID=A0ACB9QKV4_9MYRT|nr:hypothetical protein MLD38_022570 [Melastoma candidum]